MDPPYREVVFRVRVVRDVRAKLCASHPLRLALAPDPCLAPPPRLGPGGVSWCLVVSRVSWCLVVYRVSWCLVGPGGVSWCLNLPQPHYHPQGGRTGMSMVCLVALQLRPYVKNVYLSLPPEIIMQTICLRYCT